MTLTLEDLDARDRRLGLIDDQGRPTTVRPLDPVVEKNGHRWVPIIGVGLVALTVLAGFMLWTFKTNAAGDLEHVKIEGRIDLQQQAQRSLFIEVKRQGDNIVKIGDKVKATGLEPPQLQIPPEPGQNPN